MTPQRLDRRAAAHRTRRRSFGLRRGGLSLDGLRKRHPHGLVLAEHVATGVLPGKIRHRPRRVRLAPPATVDEIVRLVSANGATPSSRCG